VVYPEKGANTLVTASKIKEAAVILKEQLPLKYSLINNYDSTIFVKRRTLQNYQQNNFYYPNIIVICPFS